MAKQPIKASDLYQDDGAIKRGIQDLTAFGKAYEGVLAQIKKDAKSLGAQAKNLNGVMSEHRGPIKEAATEADKLRKKYDETKKAMSTNGLELERLKKAQADLNAEARLRVRLLDAEQGSYDQLSAQYSLVKKELNAMSAEQRKNTKAGQDLEAQAFEIYQQMKALQEVTGKHTLSVGDYTKGIREEGAEQRRLVASLEEVQAAYEEASKSQTTNEAALKAYEEEIKRITEEIDNLGVVTGKTSKDFKKGFIDNLADSEGAAGQAARGVQGLGKAFKALLANPVVLVISLIVGGLTALFAAFKRTSKGADTMARITGTINGIISVAVGLVSKFLEGTMKAFKDPVGAMKDFWTALKENIVNRFEGVINLAKALGGVLKGLWDRDLEAIRENAKGAGQALIQMGTGLDVQQQKDFTDAIQEQTKAVSDQVKAFADLEASRRGIAAQNRQIATSLEAVITKEELLLAIRDDSTKSFKEREDASADAGKAAEERARLETQIARNNLKLLDQELALRRRNNEDVAALEEQRLAAYRELAGAEREYTLAVRENEKERDTLKQDRLEKDLDILIDGFDNQKTINERIIADETRTFGERQAMLEETRRLFDESFNKQIATIQEFTGAQVDANDLINTSDAVVLNQKIRSLGLSEIIEGRLLEVIRDRRTGVQDLADAERDLLASQREAQKASLEAAQAQRKADQEAAEATFEQAQALEKSKFDLTQASEADRTRFELEAEKAKLAEMLRLNEVYQGNLSAAQIETIENQIKLIDQKLTAAGKSTGSIYDLFGFTLKDEEKQAIADSFTFAKEQLDAYFAKRVEQADALVQKSGEQVDAARAELEAQQQNAALGFANRVNQAQKELDLAKRNQDKALKEQERAKEAQQVIQAAQQAGNLLTASTKIWADLGFPTALLALGVLWGSFIAAQAQAFSLTKKQFGAGGFEKFDFGGSHASGNDIPLGTTKAGQQRTVERGESMGIFSRKATVKYGDMLPQIVNAINQGTLEQNFAAIEAPGTTIIQAAASDMARTERELVAIRKQGERQYFTDKQGRIVEVYKNRTRIYE